MSDIRLWPDWKIAHVIGRGSFGEVYEIHRQNGPYVERAALKMIRVPQNPYELEQLRRDGLGEEDTEGYLRQYVENVRGEIRLMQQFVGYSNIVSYEDYLINKHEDSVGWDILIRMELLTALPDYMASHPLSEEDVVQIGLDISQALVICHGAGIIHRDIKPQNIFVNKRGYYKLGDFGISRPMPGNESVLSFKGSIPYMAPETFAMKDTDARSDIYSLALVLYRILNGGREPFLSSSTFTPDEREAAQKRRMAGETLPPPVNGSPELCGVLAVALSGDPDKRYQSAAEFHEALQRIATRMHLFSTRANNIRRDQVSGQETVLLNVSKGEETVVDPGADAGHYGPTQVHRGQNAPYVNQAQRSPGGTVYDRNVVPGAANPGSQAGIYQGKSSVNQAGIYQGNPPGNPPGNYPGNPSGSYPGNPPGSHLNRRNTGSGANNQSSKKLVLALAGVLALLVIILSAALIPRMAKGGGENGGGSDSGLSESEAVAAPDSQSQETEESPGSVEEDLGPSMESEESGGTGGETDTLGDAAEDETVQINNSVENQDSFFDHDEESGTEEEAETGDEGETEAGEEYAVIDYNTDGRVRILNKKRDQDAEFQRMARRFEEESGIKVEVESPSAGKYSNTLKEKIPGGSDAPTLFMLGGVNDFEKYGSECLELTDCAAAKELTDDSYTLKGQNGKVYGLACIVEAYGLCVNTRLLNRAGYEISDIQSFSDLKRVARDITRRKDQLGFSAFTSPSVGVGVSGDYRLAEHAPVVPLYYELKDNDFNIGLKLKGTYMDCFRDYVDLYLDNATVSRSQASSKSLEDAQKEFLAEKAVFHQDGSWDYGKLQAVMGDQATVIPLYMGMPGEKNQGLNKTCSYYWCVNKSASADDIEATLQFLYWMVTSEEGIRIMTEDMDFQIPYRKAEVPDNPFLQILSQEEEEGYEAISQYYKYGSYEKWINNIRKGIRDYAEGKGSWTAVEDAFITLW